MSKKTDEAAEVEAERQAEVEHRANEKAAAKVEKTRQASETPRYKLLEKAYIDDVYYDPEKVPKDADGLAKPLVIEYLGIPGPHMEPVNAAAKEASKKAGHINADGDFEPHRIDPISALTIVGTPIKPQ